MSTLYDEDSSGFYNNDDTDYSQLDMSDYKFNINESRKREKKLQEEIALLRKMLRYINLFNYIHFLICFYLIIIYINILKKIVFKKILKRH